MNNFLVPSIIFILSSFICFIIKSKSFRAIFSLLIPILSFVCFFNLVSLNKEIYFPFFNTNISLFYCDTLTLPFSIIFHIFAFLALLYSAFIAKKEELSSALFYLGASFGVIFAKDIISFYLFWEMLTFGAFVLIFLGKEKDSEQAAFRYLLYHIFGGLCFLAGIIIQYEMKGSFLISDFNFTSLNTLSSILILIGIGVNAGFPLLHTWIVDAYPKSTISGGVFLSSLTTKLAIYALIRFFTNLEVLIYIGAVMVIFPIFFAIIENDLRKVLSYSLINQLGFMVVGIGVGTHMAINGTVSHVIAHILYKSLLFMIMGTLLYKFKTCKASSLGGLYKKMPYLTLLCIIATFSICAFPFFSGFVTKSMIISSVKEVNNSFVLFVLILGSAAVVKYLKAPYFAFFGNKNIDEKLEDNIKVKIPFSMYVAMSTTAIFCIIIGVFPNIVYDVLPYNDISYKPYTPSHIVSQLEILLFAFLSFMLCIKFKLYPKQEEKELLDIDVIYRKGLSKSSLLMCNFLENINKFFNNLIFVKLKSSIDSKFKEFSKNSNEIKSKIGICIFLVVALIVVFVVII